ncbi:MAG TPA: RDD family protein, partial [Streptosporangiaceae bacterium]|nr:RDD family protein [Streptosporangiaceae bacterium]
MTQQDETAGREHATPPPGFPVPRTGSVEERETTAPPSVAPMPSAYLPSAESVPEAYPAPPQPGQPRYGTPPADGRTERQYGQPVPSQPGHGGQPGYGQPGYGQPGYGRPGAGRFGGRGTYARARARRDPLLAGFWERIAASLLDWIIILGLPVAIFFSPLERIWHELQGIAATYPDLNSPGAQAAISSLSRDPATLSTLLHYWLAAFGFALAYFWILHTVWGATLGKRLLGTRVVHATDQSPIGVRDAGVRTIASLVGPVLFVVLGAPLNVIGGILWIADSGMPALDPRAQSLHDKAAGTIVVRKRLLDR